ncbi:hypothetical protein SLA2020_453240, partial [Shorea laevis]
GHLTEIHRSSLEKTGSMNLNNILKLVGYGERKVDDEQHGGENWTRGVG